MKPAGVPETSPPAPELEDGSPKTSSTTSTTESTPVTLYEESLSSAERTSDESVNRSDTMETQPYPYPPGDGQEIKQPEEHYDGGVSQWREEAEEMWDFWDWPPRGWKPSSEHRCWWDESSQYYGYNNYDWGRGGGGDDSTSVAATPLRRTDSSAELETVQRILRANSGDIARSLIKDLDETVKGIVKEVAKETTSGPRENTAAVKVEPPDETPQTGDKSDDKTNAEKNPENEKDAEKAPEKDPEKIKELERRKLAAHARYMRYYRNIRSHGPSHSTLIPNLNLLNSLTGVVFF